MGKCRLWFLGLALAACGKPLAPRSWAPGDVREPGGPFPIGEIATLSGPDSDPAQRFHRGLWRAIDECNAEGGVHGRRIELHVLDDRGDPAGSRLAAQRLAVELGAVALVSSSSDACRQAALEAAKPVPIVTGRNVIAAEERGHEAGVRLCEALARAKAILPVDVAAALAARRSFGD